MSMTERQKKILQTVVEVYIRTAEPVGSKAILQNSDLNLSSATVRNEMAALEEQGYLEQPHTSAGRIPSPKGYRFYVDELMTRKAELSDDEAVRFDDVMQQKMDTLDGMLSDAGKLISKITSYPTYTVAVVPSSTSILRFELMYADESSFAAVLMTSLKQVRNKVFRFPTGADFEQLHNAAQVLNEHFSGAIRAEYTADAIADAVAQCGTLGAVASLTLGFAIEILEETEKREVSVQGASTLLQHPEFRDVDKARKMLSYLSEEQELMKISDPDSTSHVKFVIGPENLAEELKDASVVVASYDIGDDMQGIIGVVGPTRMDYAKVAARLSYFAENLGKIISGDKTPLALNESHEDE